VSAPSPYLPRLISPSLAKVASGAGYVGNSGPTLVWLEFTPNVNLVSGQAYMIGITYLGGGNGNIPHTTPGGSGGVWINTNAADTSFGNSDPTAGYSGTMDVCRWT